MLDRIQEKRTQTAAIKVLVIDDETAILDSLEGKLRREGFTTFAAVSAEEGLRIFRMVKPDIIILDVMLPNRSGFELCQTIRKESATPIIFLSAKADEASRVKGLEMGADDYVVKPFTLGEMVARVRAVLRRSSAEATEETVERGNLTISVATHLVTLDEKPVALSPKEFALLHFLASHPGQVFSRDVLIDRIWDNDLYVSTRTVDVHIRWLRQHIEVDPNNPQRIMTIRGVGYKFVG